ncbi:1-phosphofructokinase family hexose kinase [Arthrobacter sp. D1-29]
MPHPRVITLTPNPAIDETYIIGRLREGETHRVEAPLTQAGGKGVNAARVLNQQGFPVVAVTPAGGSSGDRFIADLEASTLAHRIVAVRAATRRSFALVDLSNGETTIFNERGEPLTGHELQSLLDTVQEEMESSGEESGIGCLIGSGSLPPGAPADYFGRLVHLAHSMGVPAIIDTSGPALVEAAMAGADLLKPNVGELVEATGIEDLSLAARSLIARGAQRVLVSDGPNGMYAFDAVHPQEFWSARLPEPLEGNPTGAGDAAVAAAAAVLVDGGDLQELLKRSAAWSAAAVLEPGAGVISARHHELEEQLILTTHPHPLETKL